MIYFIKDTVSLAVKIGYSKDPKKRLVHLQTATPNGLILLGTVQGSLAHEAGYHEKFCSHKLQGEWFKGDILREVMEILAKATSSPPKKTTNALVVGETFYNHKPIVFNALSELHARTPIDTLVVEGNQSTLSQFGWEWAGKNKVDVYPYYPKWKKHGRFAGFRLGQQLLRAMFDPKTLLAFYTPRPRPSLDSLIRKAEKDGIEVVVKRCEG